MSELVESIDGKLITTSKKLADHFGKKHYDILKLIKRVHCSEDFRHGNFASSYYLSPQNKKLPCVNLTKDGFSFVAMGLTGKDAGEFKELYIREFNRMSDTLNGKGKVKGIWDALDYLDKEIEQIKTMGSGWGKAGAVIKKTKRQVSGRRGDLLTIVAHGLFDDIDHLKF